MSDRRLAIYTHHKCGSTWVRWAFQTILGHHGIDFFASHRGDEVPAADKPISILTNANYPVVKDHLCSENVHFIRNPLSVLSSAYYSHVTTHPTEDWERLERQRRILQACGPTEGMLFTLAFLQSPEFYPRTPGPFWALRTWDYSNPRIKTVRMEDAVTDASTFLRDMLGLAGLEDLAIPDVDQFRFERFTGRPVGQLDPASHYRSGDPERWRTDVPANVIEFVRNEFRTFLEHFYPEALVD